MRFVFGRGWVFCDETNGEGDANGGAGGAAGEGAPEGGGEDLHRDDHSGEGGEADAAGAGKEAPKEDMLGAIDKALGYDKEAVAEEKRKTDEAAAAATKAAEKHANGTPKKDAKGNELDDKGQVTKPAEAPKAKTSTELQLSKEQLAALKPESRARFAEVISTLKARETEIATLSEQVKPLTEARDAIIGVLQETNTNPDQLSAYLEFNRLVSSDKPADLESALKMIEDQRAALYTALGREPADGGIDLLAEFPDLKQKVSDATLTREDALELAAARRDRAAGEQRSQQQRSEQETSQQRKQAQDSALKEIETWTAGLSKSDIDYKAKEEKLLEQVDQVIKNYPANQWIPTLKLLYQGIVIQKASGAPNREQQPIRPAGAKPGAKAPQNMFEAMWPEKVGQ